MRLSPKRKIRTYAKLSKHAVIPVMSSRASSISSHVPLRTTIPVAGAGSSCDFRKRRLRHFKIGWIATNRRLISLYTPPTCKLNLTFQTTWCLRTLPSKIASQILNAIKALADQMQSLQTGLRTFLDDSAENLQPVIEVENQVNGQSRNASQTRLVSRGPEDNETQPEDPPSRRRSDWSMSYPVPPRQPLSPSQIINARSSLGVPGEDYKDRVAISLCPLGQHVGYLFSDRIIVGELHAEPYAEPNSEPYAEPSAPRWTVVSRFRCSLDPRYQWKDLQLAGPYLVAWGFSQSEGRSVSYLACRIQDNVITPISLKYVTSRVKMIFPPLCKYWVVTYLALRYL